MSETNVVNVKIKYIRPKYNDLKEWVNNENNIYIGRAGIVFIKNGENKERFPKLNSKWANPYKIDKKKDVELERTRVIKDYKKYILNKIENEPEIYNIEELKGKNLGCWCKPESCHGDVLLEILNNIN
jgi:hypothetical protein